MAIEAWYMDDSDADQRQEHRLNPNKPVSLEELGKVWYDATHASYSMSIILIQHVCVACPMTGVTAWCALLDFSFRRL